MELSLEQLEIKARTEYEMGLNECAIETLSFMIQSFEKIVLSNSQKTLFEDVFKDRIRKYREILCESIEELDLSEKSKEIFPSIKTTIIRQLESILHPGINLINGFLLSNCEDNSSKVFYNRILADFHRYLSECYNPSDPEYSNYLDEANKNYQDALNAANTLSPCSTYLQIIINASIFYTDYLHDRNYGITIAQDALDKYYKADQERTEDVPEEQMEEELELVEILTSNIEKWKKENTNIDSSNA